MEWVSSLFVGKPLNILVVALLLLALHVLSRLTLVGGGRQTRALLVAAAAWVAYAAWEWLVLVRTPEANIRVDLLVLWPVLLVVTVGALARALWR